MAELGDKLLTRDEALKIFEQLQKLESDVRKDVCEELSISDADFAKLNEDGSVSEALQELQYKQDVAEAQFFDRAFHQNGLEERAYYLTIQKMDI